MSVRETTPIGVFRPKAGDEEFLSVTTAVKMLANEALATYGAQEVAKAAVRLAGSLPQRIHEEGPAEVARQLADKRYARSRKNRTGRQIGAEVHDGWHTYALHEAMEEVDDEINPYLVQLKRWHKRTGFRFLAAELTGFNLELGFAGTLDTLGELQDRGVGILDLKTGPRGETKSGQITGPFGDSAIQVAGYGAFTHMAWDFRPRRITNRDGSRKYLLSGDERARLKPMPDLRWLGILHATPRRAYLYEVVPELRERELEKFLLLLKIAKLQAGPDPIGALIGEPVAA